VDVKSSPEDNRLSAGVDVMVRVPWRSAQDHGTTKWPAGMETGVVSKNRRGHAF
jgi:hypothetical protein